MSRRNPSRTRQSFTVKAPPTDYEEQLRKSRLTEAVVLIQPDFETKLLAGDAPELTEISDSANQRAEQLALLAELQHQAAGDPEIGALLTELEGGAHAGLDADQRIVVHHARRDYDRVTRLPADFVAEQAAHASRAYHAWAAARKKSSIRIRLAPTWIGAGI